MGIWGRQYRIEQCGNGLPKDDDDDDDVERKLGKGTTEELRVEMDEHLRAKHFAL